MKISRHDQKEENKTTALWLYEFAYDLEKNAQNVDYLKEYLNKLQKGKKFESIDEKLADIRSRVGLDLAIKLSNEIDNINNHVSLSSTTPGSCCGENKKCSCEVKVATTQHSEHDIQLMNNILKYIRDMIQHEPHLDSTVILARCQDEEGLRFNDLKKKIDFGKLTSYINDLLGINKDSNIESVSYTPSKALTEFEADDRIAEYYNHAEPHRA